jgi:histidyl-tRNA synthetase
MKNVIPSVKGTREFYPEDMAIRTWLYGQIRQVSECFGYQEYEGPFLETIDLYAAKSGEELVKEQSFVFPDRGGNLITLRPELTPSLARMVAQRQQQFIYPLRWWSFGPFWRYEKPQKGRTREFFQWNIDLIGINKAEADAELVAICASFFRQIGLTPDEVKILVNDRRLVERQLEIIGIDPELRATVLRLMDRRDKMRTDEWQSYAGEEGFSSNQIDGLENLLNDQDAYQRSEDLMRFFNALDALQVRDYVQFDPRIVRGLDYYTGIVFEARDAGEQSRAILGGGHYDNLVADVGGDPLPGVGFAMGDVVILILLAELGKLPKPDVQPTKVLVTVFDDELMAYSLSIANTLRKGGLAVQVYPECAKLAKQIKFADRTDIPIAIIAGPEEQERQELQVKELRTGLQVSLPIGEAAEKIQSMLAGG